ncbi:hypothetical protein K439DRAFT_1613264 [Ramaria rubella]|nr:hypothetical protein K439DRAFT_1613264 [Ramaria rubella]
MYGAEDSGHLVGLVVDRADADEMDDGGGGDTDGGEDGLEGTFCPYAPVSLPLGTHNDTDSSAAPLTFGSAGSAVMQFKLSNRLSPAFTALFPPHQNLPYAAIDILVLSTPELMQQEFAAFDWGDLGVLAGITSRGLVSCVRKFIHVHTNEPLQYTWLVCTVFDWVSLLLVADSLVCQPAVTPCYVQ